MKASIMLFTLTLLISCQQKLDNNKTTSEKKVLQTEKAFEALLSEKGFAEAFFHYADTGAVINREGKIIKGKEAIRKYYQKRSSANATLNWSPEFVDVSESGDLAYTYGKYIYSQTDSTGQATKFEGYFHTVWKKQKNGDWKYVWD